MAEPVFPAFAVSRLRMTTDGAGVTTLVTAVGCPLRCRYCINPQSWDGSAKPVAYTPQALLERVRVDNLYFQATGGGVTFGGGEPLLYADFLRAFREICPTSWKLRAETSLNVPWERVETAERAIDEFFADIKDCDPAIYFRYTGEDNARAMDNLKRLVEKAGPERVTARVPLIPGYNTQEDRSGSVERLKAIGVRKFDCFEYVTPGKTPQPPSATAPL